MEIRLESPVLPPAPPRYDPRAEQEFRSAVLRQLQEIVEALRQIAVE